MADHIHESEHLNGGKESENWTVAHQAAYGQELSKLKSENHHSSLPSFELASGRSAHEETHASKQEKAGLPNLDALKDPKNGLSVINQIENWVEERDKVSCIDPKQLADALMNFANESMKHWPTNGGEPQEPDGQYHVYEKFDKLLDKLDKLNKDNEEWNDPSGGPNSLEDYMRRLPWHYMPKYN